MPRLLVDEIHNSSGYQENISEIYKSLGTWRIETAETIDPQKIVKESMQYKSIPIWKLSKGTKTFYTSIPISVKIYRDGEFFFAENEKLVVCGTGETPADALKDLVQHIVYFFNYYRKINEQKLMGDAIRLKKIYSNLLVEE